MGKRIRKADKSLPERVTNEKKTTGRAESADATVATGARRSGKEYDTSTRQEERIDNETVVGA